MNIVDHRSTAAFLPYWQVRIALKWINANDLRGVGCVELVDSVPQEVTSVSPSMQRALAWYSRAQGSTPPTITLNIGAISERIPFLYWGTPVATLLIASYLAHEVGHHLAATRGYILKRTERLKAGEYEEAGAHRYAYSVIERMQCKWKYKLGRLLMNDLAAWFHVSAVLDWKEGKYERAGEQFGKACELNPDLQETGNRPESRNKVS